MVSVKVAFIGTHGVGKTTLCFELAALLKHRGHGVDIVKEVARLSPLPINRQTSIDAQVWILVTQVAEEIRSASHNQVVICDRSVLDNYAYLARACGRQPDIERFVDYWLQTYDVLFKVPVVGRAAPDGVRDVDADFVHRIDCLVDELLEEKRVAHERLDAASRAAWARQAGDAVAERLQRRVPATPAR
jgi:nicotinamide riboside kinase